MTSGRMKLGKMGEEIAASFLQGKNYEIVERNYRRYRGEIDLIARDGGYLVFVEVKTARSLKMGPPILRVDSRKRRQMGRVAAAYFQEHDLFDQDARFDIVTVTFEDNQPRIEHFENAFWLEAPS